MVSHVPHAPHVTGGYASANAAVIATAVARATASAFAQALAVVQGSCGCNTTKPVVG